MNYGIIKRIKVRYMRILKLILKFEIHSSDRNVTYQIQKINFHYILYYIKLTSSKRGETSSAILFRSTLRKYFCHISNAHSTQFQRRSLTVISFTEAAEEATGLKPLLLKSGLTRCCKIRENNGIFRSYLIMSMAKISHFIHLG